MKKVQIGPFTVRYEVVQTEQCPLKITENIYIEQDQRSNYLLGETTMSVYEFYLSVNPDLSEKEYQLSENFQRIIKRFPVTNQQKIFLDQKGSYSIRKVPVYITIQDYILAATEPETHSEFLRKVENIHFFPIQESEGISYKRLRLDGRYASREKLDEKKADVKIIQDQLELTNEMYYFGPYNYAGVIQFLPEYGISTYDQFHEAYGKHVYSFTISKAGQTIPLLWPDYLYHRPENHLEFGLLAQTNEGRYAAFEHWEAGEDIQIDLLAEGFEEVHFTSQLKKPLVNRPQLSQTEYKAGEQLSLLIDPELVAEVLNESASVVFVTPAKDSLDGLSILSETTDDQLLFSTDLLTKGRYQLKINSPVYGQLLFLFTVKQERPEK